MSAPPRPAPAPESLLLPGPAGDLEVRVDFPAPAADAEPVAPAAFAVVCHPHPLFGGTLTNKVVHTLARACNDCGMPSLRFNFRGVGASAGTHDGGPGEVDDALAVIRHGRERWPRANLWLAGFSFGAAVAVRASTVAAPAALVAVAPAVDRMDIGAVAPACPWLGPCTRSRSFRCWPVPATSSTVACPSCATPSCPLRSAPAQIKGPGKPEGSPGPKVVHLQRWIRNSPCSSGSSAAARALSCSRASP